MEALSVREFRNHLSVSLDRVDAGESVFIRRNNKIYVILPTEESDLTVSPDLQSRINKARQEYLEGKSLVFANAHEAQQWMDSL